MDLKSLCNGVLEVDHEYNRSASIAAEGAGLFLEFDAERPILGHSSEDCRDWIIGYTTYLRCGALQLAKANTASANATLRSTQWR